MFSNLSKSFWAGIAVGLAFAPIYFFPGLFGLSYVLYNILKEAKYSHMIAKAYIFGVGMYLPILYWIAIGVGVYIEEFWWAIPFALLGLPIILGCFPAIALILTNYICCKLNEKQRARYTIIVFMCSWLLSEWLVSWVFTGLPWGLLGYVFSFSIMLTQAADTISVFGLSVVAIYIGSSLYAREAIISRIIVAIIMLLVLAIYGFAKLNDNPTEFSETTVRIVQPSIPQDIKWEEKSFWSNLEKHIELSTVPSESGVPNIIIWSEAALTRPYYFPPIYEKLLMMLMRDNQVLITGAVTDNSWEGFRYGEFGFQIYSSIIALDAEGDIGFEYHKSHLVPFGEYMPLKGILPTKKLTPGLLDYTQGQFNLVKLTKHNLAIKPQICYEAIFSAEVRSRRAETDVIINVTNDSWYGKSSGPYQHFEISRIRAIENGLPLLRAASNGISAIVDPCGRIVKKLALNEVGFVDGYIPQKLSHETLFSRMGLRVLPLILIFVLLLHELTFLLTSFGRKN